MEDTRVTSIEASSNRTLKLTKNNYSCYRTLLDLQRWVIQVSQVLFVCTPWSFLLTVINVHVYDTEDKAASWEGETMKVFEKHLVRVSGFTVSHWLSLKRIKLLLVTHIWKTLYWKMFKNEIFRKQDSETHLEIFLQLGYSYANMNSNLRYTKLP